MNNKKEGKLIKYAVVTLIVVSILLAGCGILIAHKLYNYPEEFVGPQGEQGIPGIGINGTDGKDGYTPVKGIDYDDGKDGARGPKGASGTGAKGDKGDKGDPGKDYVSNQPPVITFTNLTGWFEETPSPTSYWRKWLLEVTIDDPENDMMTVDFLYKFNENDSWCRKAHFIGNNDNYSCILMRHGSGCLDLYMGVEVDDGHNLVWDFYDRNSCPPEL